ncbi:MAG: cytidylate kinase-like family protein [Bacteroidetes bacterium]|nr:cytidylate kinase-like family protein [Bacteroidota bacterium]
MFVKGPFEKAKQYVEAHPKLSPEKKDKKKIVTIGPCITISRETGARADIISEKIIEFFQKSYNGNPVPWTMFDKNLIEKVIQDHHLPQNLIKIMEEEKYSAVKSIMIELLGGQPPIFTLVHKTTETILQLAQIGNVIILDRAANIITSKQPNSFHVRLVAPLEDRIEHVRELFNYDRQQAMDFIKHEDIDRRDYVMNYFHKEISDPLQYNLTINTRLMTDDESAELIGNAVLKKFPDMFSLGD